MSKEDFINALRDLIECYDQIYTKDSAANIEIRMWRERFLKTLPFDMNIERSAYTWNVFNFIPCDSFNDHTPEEHIQRIINQWNNTHK